MKTYKLIELYKNLSEYKIVPAQKRTIRVLEYGKIGFKGMIDFPKSIFFKYTISSTLNSHIKSHIGMAFAINEENEICHQPFFNVNCKGNVCMFRDDMATLDDLIQNFYNQPFYFCTDTFSYAIRYYDTYLTKYKEMYKNPIKLIPIKDDYLNIKISGNILIS